jgi:NAD(P)-dependent dehydrogenase (short-subunit alcohol dehydrogenase family)
LSDLLSNKVGLVVGIANECSIGAGCAQAFRDAGAELVLTCREKSMRFVESVAKAIEPRLLLALDVETDGSQGTVRYLAAELGPQGIRAKAPLKPSLWIFDAAGAGFPQRVGTRGPAPFAFFDGPSPTAYESA